MSIIRSLAKQTQLQESEENADVASLTESQESGKMIKSSFFQLNFTVSNTVHYIILLYWAFFSHPSSKTDTLRNNGSFMFPKHSFIFCSLIILATTPSSVQEFPEFQKESGFEIVDYRAVSEAVKSSPKRAIERKATLIGQTKKDSPLENMPLKMVMVLQHENSRVRKTL